MFNRTILSQPQKCNFWLVCVFEQLASKIQQTKKGLLARLCQKCPQQSVPFPAGWWPKVPTEDQLAWPSHLTLSMVDGIPQYDKGLKLKH